MSTVAVDSPIVTSKFNKGQLSPEQVTFFRENGYMKLEQVIEPEIVQGLLSRAKQRMGEDPLTVKRGGAGERIKAEYRWYARWDECSVEDEWVRSLSHSPKLASIASQLCGEPVRFYSDHVFAKAPATKSGGDTPLHQDFPHHPHDRQGALNIWIALVDCLPEKGTMRFLEGSHRAGQLGRYFNRRDNVTLIDEHP
jgi:ectoine hydroxylase-related dioxygenase (phytanoyl-CoA dioxygenase family)